MNKSLLKIAGSLLAAMALSSATYAVKMVGEINLSGVSVVGLINDTGPGGAANPNNADALDFSGGGAFLTPNTTPNAFVQAGTGAFAGLEFMTATMQDFRFNPGLFPVPVEPLWTLLNGYSFSLDSITLVNQSIDDFLNIKGNGRFNGTGYEETVGTWSFTVTTQGSLFTWTSANISVPDGGATALLLGAGLLGLGLIRRVSKKN